MPTCLLDLAVQEAYRVFGKAPQPKLHLNVCTGCCMEPALEHEMRTLPLRQLQTHHFYEYADGAMRDMVQPAAEIKFLLPRWLELLAQGAHLRHSLELALDRVGCCPSGSFSSEELGALNGFMLAYFDAGLCGTIPASGGWHEGYDAFSVLLMADYAGLDLDPLLTHWLSTKSPMATVRFVEATFLDYWPDGEVGNAFAGDRTNFKTTIHTWMEAPATQATFLNKLMDPAFLALLDHQTGCVRASFDTMAGAVFDQLAAQRSA